MKHRRWIATALTALVLGVLSFVVVADEVTPAALQLECLRTTQSSGNVTDTVYWQGDYITFTNSTMYTTSTTNTPQNLDGCSITVTMGSLTTTNPATAVGYVISTNAGTWGAEIVCPAANPCYIEVSVSNTYNYTYPRYRIQTQAKLGE